MTRTSRARRAVAMLGALVVGAVAAPACDRIVDLTPLHDAASDSPFPGTPEPDGARPPIDGGFDDGNPNPDDGNLDPIDSGRADGNLSPTDGP